MEPVQSPSLDAAPAAPPTLRTPPSAFGPLQDPRLIARPYPAYAALRSTHPVLRAPLPAEGAGVWMLTRYVDVERVLRDREREFSVDRSRAQFVRESGGPLPPALAQSGGALRSMLVTDPPDHTRVRKLVNQAFSPRRIAALEGRVRDRVDELIRPLRGESTFELIEALAAPLPALVIAELLGVPPGDHGKFKQWSARLVALLGHPRPAEVRDEFQSVTDGLLSYLGEIIAERRSAPRDDLISAMIEAQEESDALSDAELLASANLILIAGHETTTNLIGNGTRALLRHPEELERLRAEPSLLPSAIEELLRYDSPVQATVRVPVRDVEIGERTIPRDALVIVNIGAANHDPEVFDKPGRLDLARDPNPHLCFGFGAHFCLGAALARLEARAAFEALLETFPKLAFADEEPRFRPNPVLRGLESLTLRASA